MMNKCTWPSKKLIVQRLMKPGDFLEVGEYRVMLVDISEKDDSPIYTFCFDTYLSDWKSNRADLIQNLDSWYKVYDGFDQLRPHMVPMVVEDRGIMEKSCYLRVPTVGEMFKRWDDRKIFLPDDPHNNQWNDPWSIMQDKHYRATTRNGDWEWGWLMNRCVDNNTYGGVSSFGTPLNFNLESNAGIRPVFKLCI